MGYSVVMRRFTLPLLAAGALLVVPACSSSSSSTGAAAVSVAPRVDPAGAVVIDVRTPGEFDSGHLEGAVNIDVQAPDFAAKISSLEAAGRYLVYCRSGNRSQVAIDIMRSLGFTNLTDLGSVAEASAATGLAVI